MQNSLSTLGMAAAAKRSSISLAAIQSEIKNFALEEIAKSLLDNMKMILEANNEDIKRSEKEGLAKPLIKRLKFDENKINEVVAGIRSLISLPEPVGVIQSATELDEELQLYRVSCPIGVIGVIFESRPDALVQISTLCLKSGNAVMLKGGSEASATNSVLAQLINHAASKANIPDGWIQLLKSRDDVNAMLKMDQYIDLIIPRGSNDFVRYIMNNSSIPVMGHADGICHCYVDKDADIDMAVDVVTDSKAQYVSVCNATETLLVHESIAPSFLPQFKKSMDLQHVELVGCEATRAFIDIVAATEDDWKTEYLDHKLSIKIVPDITHAIMHINTYGSGHTDTIITKDRITADYFMSLVDSGNVFWNCSTRFSDGFRYGFGAEVGVSTNKIHARGPVGLDGLLIYKYKLFGNGHKVADYANKVRSFKHRKIDI